MQLDEYVGGLESELEGRDDIEALLAVSPRAAAMEAYRLIEGDLRRLLVESGLVGVRQSRQSLRYLAGTAQNAGLLDNQTESAIRELTVLRNLLAHPGLESAREELDLRRAKEFIGVALELRRIIARLPRGRAYIAAVALAFKRIGVPVEDLSQGIDRGWDMLAGSERRIGVILKMSDRPLSDEVIERSVALGTERPLLLVANISLAASAFRRLDGHIASGSAVRYVKWSSPDDDTDLAAAVAELLPE